MAIRNCETRPVTWKINRNKQVSNAVIAMGEYYKDPRKGFIIWPIWIGFITHRDNLGFFDGAPGILKDSFYPHFPWITIEEVKMARNILADKGLIIVYEVEGIEYILVPKVSHWSQLVGNISDKTDFPLPSLEKIKAWEERFNDVYTPLKRRTNGVYTPYERRTNGVYTEIEIEIENINKYIQVFFEYFLLKTKKSFKLTPERRSIIEKRFKEGRTLEELKQAVDNFTSDEWQDRHKFIDIIYCIGVRNKVDNLDKWLNFKPKPKRFKPKPKSDCDVCGGSGIIQKGVYKGGTCFCIGL